MPLMPLRDHRLSWEQRKTLHERLTRSASVARDDRERADIGEAITRLEAADYGRCVDCGAPIAWDRLLASPQLRRCMRCERAGVPEKG